MKRALRAKFLAGLGHYIITVIRLAPWIEVIRPELCELDSSLEHAATVVLIKEPTVSSCRPRINGEIHGLGRTGGRGSSRVLELHRPHFPRGNAESPSLRSN